MSFEVQIKVDPGTAVSTIDNVTGALAKAEAQAPKTGSAISRAFKSAADGVKGIGAAFTKDLSGVGDSLKNSLLSTIGPAAAVQAGLGMITGVLDEIDKNRQAFNKATADMLSFKGSVDAARASVEALKDTSKLLGTDIGAMTNMFLDLEEAAHSLGLSEEQLMNRTRDLGAMMVADRKPVENMGEVMGILQFAIDKNNLSQMEMARLIKANGILADKWASTLGMTRKELLAAAAAGNFNADAIRGMIFEIKANNETLEIMEKRLEATFGVEKALTGEWQAGRRELDKMRESIKLAAEEINPFTAAMLNAADATLALSRDAQVKLFVKSIELFNKDVKDAVDKTNRYADAAKRAAEETKRWREQFEKLKEARFVGDGRKHRRFDQIDSVGGGIEGLDLSTGNAGNKLRFLNNESEADQWANLAGEIARANLELTAFDKAWGELSDNMEQGVLQQVNRLGDGLADLFMTGEFGWRKMIDAMIKDMTRLLIQQAVMFGFKSAFPSFGVAGSAGLDFKVPGFSGGGHARVDTDSIMLGMRVSPNERIIVQTPGQRMGSNEAARQAPAPQPVIVNQYDRRALLQVLETREGATVIHNILRAYPGLLR